ncbi:MAG: extracellular solute-binding protein [Thermoflexales bacterium]|nr:extracellular solute-binding protein [Thermoflexales bacterium]MDW8054252.1 extracellular solute-binding protein [Anaerolineae bacterium]MDW8292228.1 extracellular solute-binding protein [Anaerolineae bacterium]
MKMQKVIAYGALITAMLVVGNAHPASAQTRVVNVYSARHYGALEKVFAEFTRETGIQVRLSSGSSQALLERLRADGKQTPADVFLVIDAGTLQIAAQEGLLQPIRSQVLETVIPAELRDPQGRWFALTQRMRTIVYNPRRVKPEEVQDYADLANPKWRGRLCLRPATHIYTIALTSYLIANRGEREAERIVRGWVANRPQYIDSDSRILETIAAGKCDVAITNHYYLGNQLRRDPNFPVALAWANQKGSGVQVNVTGAGVTAGALNRDDAVKLLEWLATRGQDPGDAGLPGGNSEYPANPSQRPPAILERFGTFKADYAAIARYGELQAQSIKLLERARYR